MENGFSGLNGPGAVIDVGLDFLHEIELVQVLNQKMGVNHVQEEMRREEHAPDFVMILVSLYLFKMPRHEHTA